ncbi:hybrid sensor histidine kinase/response regulator [Allorhizobium taibaishanense]|uniref:histidine kinase n=1 Tax=Allorhizobium taibaishanense TaxID=887144 RepID=A0A1Q9AAY7_9HYPH|nr:hybrid sensor histidine kinase/response regulator [Allorhizobium taibaishanense]MBB4010416.1 signal transduction histidine kinase [Allorhizobium taibaishanense]OLP52005.1 hybrid sensor histidine kinase/response regulator [Allorhizobium taibaishanense]
MLSEQANKLTGYKNEQHHAATRATVIGICCVYIVTSTVIGHPLPGGIYIACMVTIHLLMSCSLLLWIRRRPGDSRPRHYMMMVLDISGMTYMMAVGGALFLPLYMVMQRLVVANGLTYGPTSMKISTSTALASIATVTYFNSYWRDNPFMVLTLASGMIMMPSQIYVMHKRLEEAYTREQEASLSKSRFLAQASHDLRQPVHAISLFTACLRDAKLRVEELKLVDNIDRSLQSVSRLFKSLLDISTLDSGNVQPNIEPVAIRDIVDDVVHQNAEAAQRVGSSLRVIACDAVVKTDHTLFSTMLQNIVNNAVKYAPGAEILIACRRRGGTLAVQVYDRGPGIPVEHQTKVFDEFHQVRGRGDKDVEGVGLGLAIVRRLGTMLDIEVSLRSTPGRGTCITLGNLPIHTEAVPAPRPVPLAEPGLADGLRVLLVEDDEAVLTATAILLRKWGCDVQTALTPPDKVGTLDLLITDFDLGNGITGKECIEQVQRLAGRTVPTVVMTGHDRDRVREELATPDVPILAKPVRPAELRSLLLAQAVNARSLRSPQLTD